MLKFSLRIEKTVNRSFFFCLHHGNYNKRITFILIIICGIFTYTYNNLNNGFCAYNSVYYSENKLCPILCHSYVLLKDPQEAPNLYWEKKSVRDPQRILKTKQRKRGIRVAKISKAWRKISQCHKINELTRLKLLFLSVESQC